MVATLDPSVPAAPAVGLHLEVQTVTVGEFAERLARLDLGGEYRGVARIGAAIATTKFSSGE